MQPTTVRRAFDRLLILHDVPIEGTMHLGGKSGGPSAADVRASHSPRRKADCNPRDGERTVAPDHVMAHAHWLVAEISDVAATLLLAPAQAPADLALKLIVLIAMVPSDCEAGEGLLYAGLSALLADLTQVLPARN